MHLDQYCRLKDLKRIRTAEREATCIRHLIFFGVPFLAIKEKFQQSGRWRIDLVPTIKGSRPNIGQIQQYVIVPIDVKTP
jgi:hypothetical protein